MLLDLDAPGDGVIYTSNGNSHLRAARPLPDRDLWFECVWKKQLEKDGDYGPHNRFDSEISRRG